MFKLFKNFLYVPKASPDPARGAVEKTGVLPPEPDEPPGLELTLARVAPVRGIYDGKLPKWAHYLHPEAAASLKQIEEETGGLVYTSMWRSANASLWAIKNKQGALPPGYSAHNYGLAIDLTLDTIKKERGWRYSDILELMESYGWYCHRRDGKERFEAWHFNFFGDFWGYYSQAVNPRRSSTWHLAAETQIEELYGNQFKLTITQAQEALQSLGFYQQSIDGDFGAKSTEALNTFQRAYRLKKSKTPTPKDMRTLAFCTHQKVLTGSQHG